MRLWNGPTSASSKPGLLKRIFSKWKWREVRCGDQDDTDRDLRLLHQHFSHLGISPDFILEMRDVFQLFDKDKNGYICSRELASVLRAYGCNPTEREVFSLMAEVDVNHNGKIELSEFVLMMHNNISQPDYTEEIRVE